MKHSFVRSLLVLWEAFHKFYKGTKKFVARVGTTHNDAIRLEIRQDGVDG